MKRLYFTALLASIVAGGIGCTEPVNYSPEEEIFEIYQSYENWCATQPCGAFKDSRDNNEYEFTTIEGLRWMRENLRYVPHQDTGLGQPSLCRTASMGACITNFGRFYTWRRALGMMDTDPFIPPGLDNIQGVCPPDWRLPTPQDWDRMKHGLGPNLGLLFKTQEFKGRGWYGFKAIATGYFLLSLRTGILGDPVLEKPDEFTAWWVSFPQGEVPQYRGFSRERDDLLESWEDGNLRMLPVRCVQDAL